MWSSPSCSSSPSCASCGPVPTAAPSPPGRAALAPRERTILAARHGLDGQPPRTLQEIALALGLTRQAVHQAEARALARLRTAALRRWLADDPAS